MAPDNLHKNMESKESLEIAQRALESLPDNQREVIRLSSYMDAPTKI